jgi:hypothetical protein
MSTSESPTDSGTTPPPEVSQAPKQAGRGPEAVEKLEKQASRALFVLGLLALAIGSFVTEGHRLPANVLLAWIGVFVASKLVLAVLGLRAGWKAWPALVAELAALAMVGLIVQQEMSLDVRDSSAILIILAVAVLLAAAGLLRRRASQAKA